MLRDWDRNKVSKSLSVSPFGSLFPLGPSFLYHYQYYFAIKVDQEKERERERLDERRGRREVETILENVSIRGIHFFISGEGEKH